MNKTAITAAPILPVLAERWSPRSFSNEALTEEQLLTLLEAARWAPSAYNAQPWRFIYGIKDTPHWDRIFETLLPFNQSWAKTAGALVVIASNTHLVPPGKEEKVPNKWHSFDAGAAWANLALQAVHSGLAAHGLAGFDSDNSPSHLSSDRFRHRCRHRHWPTW
jgi:nitroreductase